MLNDDLKEKEHDKLVGEILLKLKGMTVFEASQILKKVKWEVEQKSTVTLLQDHSLNKD